VLYTDVDPEIVAVGRQVLGDRDGVEFTTGDVTDLASIDATTLDRVLPNRAARPVGLVFLGLAAFLEDTTLARTLDAMYEVVPAGSHLAFDFDTLELSAYPEALAMMGPVFHMRAPSEFGALLGRWTPGPDGVVPVARWRPDGSPEDVPDAFWGGVAVS
jgi:hypothetical protein